MLSVCSFCPFKLSEQVISRQNNDWQVPTKEKEISK